MSLARWRGSLSAGYPARVRLTVGVVLLAMACLPAGAQASCSADNICATADPGVFGTETDGSVGAANTFTITNAASSAGFGSGAQITRVRTAGPVTGDAPDDFLISQDNCTGSTLAPGESCTVGVRFAPSKVGPEAATLRIAYSINFSSSSGTTTARFTGTGQSKPAVSGTTTPGPSGGGSDSEKFVLCRRYTERRGKPVLCTVRYSTRGRPVVQATLSRDGRNYATGRASAGKVLRLRALRHLTEGHYRLARTYNGRNVFYDTVRVLIIR